MKKPATPFAQCECGHINKDHNFIFIEEWDNMIKHQSCKKCKCDNFKFDRWVLI
jgi:hypothetical protein